MVVSVEIEQKSMDAANPSHVKEVQEISFGVTPKPETTTITCVNPGLKDKKLFKLRFMDNKLKAQSSGNLHCGMTAYQFRLGIRGFFIHYARVGDVTSVMTYYDKAGKVTTKKEDVEKVTYAISLRRHIRTQSYKSVAA